MVDGGFTVDGLGDGFWATVLPVDPVFHLILAQADDGDPVNPFTVTFIGVVGVFDARTIIAFGINNEPSPATFDVAGFEGVCPPLPSTDSSRYSSR